jgi:hypothetical protein
MLRLVAAQAETLWDEALPIEVRELPDDLAALDGLLCDPGLLAPFIGCWQREALASGCRRPITSVQRSRSRRSCD